MGYLLRLAARNVTRNPRRSILSALAIVIALVMIVFAQGWLRGILGDISENTARLRTGHVRIARSEYLRRERLLPLAEAMKLGPETAAMLDEDPEVAAWAPRIRFGVMLNNRETSLAAIGLAVDPGREEDILRLAPTVAAGSYFTGEEDILLGRELADRLGLAAGDTLVLITQTAHMSATGANLVVRGVLNTGIAQIDRNHFFITLARAQDLLDLEGRASEVVVMLADPGRAEAVATRFGTRLADPEAEARPWTSEGIIGYIRMANTTYFIMYLVILLVACSAIVNTMMMVVFERTREIGTMRALGMSRAAVVGALVLEAGLIGLGGSAIGTGLGAGLTALAQAQGIDVRVMTQNEVNPALMQGVIYPELTVAAVVISMVMGIGLSLLVGFFASRRAAKLSPAEALRTM